ncbi:phosphoribosyltransferase family protein [Klebsiella pneumoniae]
MLVVDDVVTTGASLIYASKYLKDAGARNVILFALAKNISDILR